MLDLRAIRENPELLSASLRNRNLPLDPVERIVELDKNWREVKMEADGLKALRNKLSIEISEAKKKKEDVSKKIAETQKTADAIKKIDEKVELVESKMREILLNVPNMPDKSVPVAPDGAGNEEIRKWGKTTKTSKDVLPHYEAGEQLGILDFERGAKVAGSRFTFLKADAARLERALINFMLDLHTSMGWEELLPPYLVNSKAMAGTGQLPKFAEELYKTENEDLYLIPTAEVPLTNYFAGEILQEEMLPKRFVGYSTCFRREAGAYGKDIKGILRQHQFNKVELVSFSKPEESFEELEKMTAQAELVLQKLGLPYRTIALCTGDMGFASAKTYDIEAWIPSQDKYREISSCSDCTDFQARRANIRYWKKGKPEFVHTLNGSGIAVGRTMIAIMENYQDADGIAIPKALQDFMHAERIDFKK